MNPHFQLLSSEYLPTLDVTLESYEHTRTKARHYHFAAQNTENVFMVALRTMPQNSTGVAHILEHTALCGSRNFPVRDPFFSMLRRSMQTFMNAFTSSDWTAYPFATENKQDFDNLLRVYLDAVFFPNLHPLDFSQEWHRFEFDDAGNLEIKGVVYNEMKGVYGSVYSRLYEMNKALLHPETTYHYDSGGAPQVIPQLSYEEFVAFHKKHYHPTNATFFTFGDIPAAEHQSRFEDLALRFFDGEGEKVTVDNETRLLAPVRMTAGYPSSDTENPHQVHILFSWLLWPTNNARLHLEHSVIYQYLLGHSGSPLRHALETAPFAASISPLTMLDDSGRETRITTGVVTDSAEHADTAETLIFDTLHHVVENGIPTDEATGILDSLEMSLRELNTGYPYGLSLMLQAIGATTHEENPTEMLDPSRLLEEMRTQIQDTHYLAKLIRENFIENAHWTRLSATPDTQAVITEQNLETAYTARVLSRMTESEKAEIRDRMQQLSERQNTPDSPEHIATLPKVALSDIPKTHKIITGRHENSPGDIEYHVATNNLGYIHCFYPLSELPREAIALYSTMAGLIGELGFGEINYQEAQKMLAGKTSLSAGIMLFTPQHSTNKKAYFTVNYRFLMRNMNDANTLVQNILTGARFDEMERIRNIFHEKRLTLKSSLTEAGHKTAMMRAGSGNTILAQISEELEGIASIATLDTLIHMSDAELSTSFQQCFERAKQHTPLILKIGNQVSTDTLASTSHSEMILPDMEFAPRRIFEAWLSDLAVGYCAMSIPTVPAWHEDAPLLSLLGQFLRDGYLHSAIREQWGAYGSGATYNDTAESFQFFSYRDPRIEGTFADFENSLTWLLENDHDEEKLNEAKIGVIARADTPSSPAKEAKRDAIQKIQNISDEDRNTARATILNATIDDLKRVAHTYLSDLESASRVVITGKQNEEIVKKMGFDIHFLD